jgi:hypothetical protein
MIYYVINHLQVDLLKRPERLIDLAFARNFDQHFVLAGLLSGVGYSWSKSG